MMARRAARGSEGQPSQGERDGRDGRRRATLGQWRWEGGLLKGKGRGRALSTLRVGSLRNPVDDLWLGGSAEIHAGNDGQGRDPPFSLREVSSCQLEPVSPPASCRNLGGFLLSLVSLVLGRIQHLETPQKLPSYHLFLMLPSSSYPLCTVPTYQAVVVLYVRYSTVRVVGLVLVDVDVVCHCQTCLSQRQKARPILRTNETRPPGLERSA